MNSKMSKILMLAGILLIPGNASSFYNRSYNGYTFILPDAVMDRNNSKPMQLSFSEAQQWCMKNVAGSTLATIRHKDVQRDFTQFIRSALQDNKQLVIDLFSNIRLNGQYHITDEWRWVNGHPKKADLTIHEGNDELYPFYARLRREKDFSIYSENPSKLGRFICEYRDNSKQCSALLNERCYKNKYTAFTWYDARNTCSDEGGDLASFETLSDADINVSLENLSLDSIVDYWIGMQKNEWRWEDTDSAIKYTNWENKRPFNNSIQCLCLTRSLWEWKECDCFEPYPFICMLNETSAEISLPTAVTSKHFRLVIVLTSCALIVVLIIVAVAVFIIRRQRNRPVNSSRNDTPEANTNESSVYEELQEHRGNNAIYADLQRRI